MIPSRNEGRHSVIVLCYLVLLVPAAAFTLLDLLLEGHGDDGDEDEGGPHDVHPLGNHFKECNLRRSWKNSRQIHQ